MRPLRLSVPLLLLAAATSAAQRPTATPFRLRRLALDLRVDYAAQSLSGTATLEAENWTDRPATRVSLLLNRLMTASAVRDDRGRPLPFAQRVVRFHDDPMRQVTQLIVQLPHAAPPHQRQTLRVAYDGNLVGYTEIGWLYVHDRIDSAFTILRAEALAFPQLGELWEEADRTVPRTDFTYDVSVRVPRGFVVATGGTSTVHPDGDGVVWRWVSDAPSPFLNVSIAPYDTVVSGGVRVFHFRDDGAGARRLAARTTDALRTLGEWFGPLHSPPRLTIAEIPDGWGSQASLVGGVIQTRSAFSDSARLGELYHELSHLWNAPDLDTPSPRWNEGLAMFVADLLRERLDGWAGRDSASERTIAALARRLERDSALARTPMSAFGERGMTDASYSVARVMFATLYAAVGAARFDSIVGGYYREHPEGGTTRQLAAYATRVGGAKVSTLFDDWLFTTRWTALVRSHRTVSELARAELGP